VGHLQGRYINICIKHIINRQNKLKLYWNHLLSWSWCSRHMRTYISCSRDMNDYTTLCVPVCVCVYKMHFTRSTSWIYSTNFKTANDFHSMSTFFKSLYNSFDTNIAVHTLRMIHKGSSALVVKTLYYNTVNFLVLTWTVKTSALIQIPQDPA
jgi:hypothetical protein